jgi:hypothetical protein
MNSVAVQFFGVLSEDQEVQSLLRGTLDRFTRAKAYLRRLSGVTMSDSEKEKVAGKFGVDKFLIDDISSVGNGSVGPPINIDTSAAFWTLGRSSPRWGMPWASLTLRDHGQCDLGIRWGGSFEDDEDPPKMVRVSIAFENPLPNDIEQLLFSSRIDLWMQMEGSLLRGVLVMSDPTTKSDME